MKKVLAQFLFAFSQVLQAWMPESDGNPMAESDKFFLPLCDKFFWGRVIIDKDTITVPNTVRQL